ncbi:hypothetical protein [Glutamicibacter endophyticus]|uniref:hypothetical protein n=1 Tax=Glutamicibacter endophyticus TaxID=1522174 RepID=UPI003AF1B9CC
MSPTPAPDLGHGNGKNDRDSGDATITLPEAQAVPVQCAGLLLTGWAIRRDTVLLEAGGLTRDCTVELNGEQVTPSEIQQGPRLPDSWRQVTVLHLPAGSLPVDGERAPAGFEFPTDDRMGARVMFWCRLFPWLYGC